MTIPKLSEQPALREAQQRFDDAHATRNQLQTELQALQARQSELHAKRATGSADEMEELQALPARIQRLSEGLDLAQRRRDEASRKLDQVKQQARQDLLTSSPVRREIEKTRSRVAQAARKLAEVNKAALDLEHELIEAGIANHRGTFGDCPRIALVAGGDADVTQGRLLAGLAQIDELSRSAA